MADAIETIRQYKDRYLFLPKANWPEYWFNDRVYARWAAEEIMRRIRQNPKLSPKKIITHFIEQMDEFALLAEKHEKDYIFVIARDEAKNILTLF